VRGSRHVTHYIENPKSANVVKVGAGDQQARPVSSHRRAGHPCWGTTPSLL